ncbi:unnamed protein product [Phaedon cochleariae]|uniref:Uncharacterized protein n=1 Tax=Phaedon cochleariae TaxID=80249 RepID=A0A9N9X2Z2_PHACE|nr:unnamed protein product [Phaedon cochleariae]
MPQLSKKNFVKSQKAHDTFKPPLLTKENIEKVLGDSKTPNSSNKPSSKTSSISSKSKKNTIRKVVSIQLSFEEPNSQSSYSDISYRMNEPAVKDAYLHFVKNLSQATMNDTICSTPLVDKYDDSEDIFTPSEKLVQDDEIKVLSQDEKEKASGDSGFPLSQEMLNSQEVKEKYLDFMNNMMETDEFNFMKNFKEPAKKKTRKSISVSHSEGSEKSLIKKQNNIEKEPTKKKPKQIKEPVKKLVSKKQEGSKSKSVFKEPRRKKDKKVKQNIINKINKNASKENNESVEDDNTLSLREKMLLIQESRNVGLYCLCDTCDKARYLPDIKDPLDLPTKWYCSMNPDPDHNKCSDPEEALVDEEFLVENLFNAGSIVWAKMDGYPWWPAMVEDDPDTEDYFYFEKEDDSKPMCPISGLVQFLIVVVTLLLVCHAVIVNSFKIAFKPNSTTVTMYDSAEITYKISDVPPDETQFVCFTENKHVASLDKEFIISSSHNLTGKFNISGNFLGGTVIKCKSKRTQNTADGQLDVVVVRKKRVIDTVFTASVATLVSILYINFGCAIDWGELKHILKKPIGPSIGFFGHFVIMPVLSYLLGLLLFPDNPEMQLGMFFTGVSPAGGASNVWAVLLEGNISLSIIMTAVSTIAAFAMMPLWIFTLGRVIFHNAKLQVPYSQIMTYVIALVVPLAIGYLIQRYLKRVANFMTKIIKGFSSCLIMFIIVFAIVTNLYLFELFSWQIILAGMALPWIGYLSGYLIAKLLNQKPEDCLTIAIEVGIQNTGIAIFLLRFALPQPQADLTTVAPVSVAILTPFPLLFLFIFKKLNERLSHSHCRIPCEDDPKIDNNTKDLMPISLVKTIS